ncbi:hypothetical protein BJP34_32510 [Moorena producens PAL-8-15-08-1]|uniref:Uncharacterized protein n=1 Tax=Moorena producens PAL-8-15-08-1 TaxID=1458985 RepID=A0A1D8U1F8_9CYAN|nr:MULTISPECIES: hypothetical protein [Moorena]AOX03526.1 hypothetical protein BJP34_32510 [Moorena producens PAL-8-15-08-1]NEO77891.1 hypothetical protein [Moorena sp. SIO4G3]
MLTKINETIKPSFAVVWKTLSSVLLGIAHNFQAIKTRFSGIFFNEVNLDLISEEDNCEPNPVIKVSMLTNAGLGSVPYYCFFWKG